MVESAAACGTALPAIGLWPVAVGEEPNIEHLEHSARLVERLLPTRGAGQGPEARVEALNLLEQEGCKMELTRLLREVERMPRPEALNLLADHAEFQINNLKPGIFTEQNLTSIQWVEWRGKTGKLLAWSGLTQGEDWPELRLSLDADNPQTRKLLEVRWACFPVSLKKGCVDFVVEIMAGGDALASRTLSHNGKAEQRCSFSPEDFPDLPENSSITAKVEMRALGQDGIIAESENF